MSCAKCGPSKVMATSCVMCGGLLTGFDSTGARPNVAEAAAVLCQEASPDKADQPADGEARMPNGVAAQSACPSAKWH